MTLIRTTDLPRSGYLPSDFVATHFARLSSLVEASPSSEAKNDKVFLHSLKQILSQSHKTAHQILLSSSNGCSCARYLSKFQDNLITLLFELAKKRYCAISPNNDKIMLAATGGYGRGMLAPYSDIDLLFIANSPHNEWTKSLIEQIQHWLWDLGFNLGHAVRTPVEVIEYAKIDMTVRTSILETRYITGDRVLYDEMKKSFEKQFQQKLDSDFIESKLSERQLRHNRVGTSRYLVEPDIKNGKGGLRDLYSLFWIGKYVYKVSDSAQLVDFGVFTHKEWRLFCRCERFLWTVRCHLHFLSKRITDKIRFDVQSELAQNLGYKSRKGILHVERFMKHYFFHAKQVGDLTRILCGALEAKAIKPLPLNPIKNSSEKKSLHAAFNEPSDFYDDSNRLRANNHHVFSKDKVNFIRLFHLAGKTQLRMHSETLHLITRSLYYIDKKMRHDKEANRLFIEILTKLPDPETLLRRMNEAGVLGRFIPEFGRIICLMQFGMYHHYTVDEHLLRAVGILHEIESGHHRHEHPLCSLLSRRITQRLALYAAVFFHDIAKGLPQDHSIAGAVIAKKMLPRLGLKDSEIETASWLIRHHLLMNKFAQERDLNDPKTIADFAKIVDSQSKLNALLILTVCDIRAVGPGVWNGWKGSLLRNLYYLTTDYLAGTKPFSKLNRITEARHKLQKALKHWGKNDIDKYTEMLTDNYLASVSDEFFTSHAELFKKHDFDINAPTFDIKTNVFKSISVLTVLIPDSADLLLVLAGCCALHNHSIVEAVLSLTNSKIAINTLYLKRHFDDDKAELRSVRALAKFIKLSLRDKHRVLQQLRKKQQAAHRLDDTFSVKASVAIHNQWSDEFSVIEVTCIDSPGILSYIAAELSKAKLFIHCARIKTLGEKVVDIFYVSDLDGKKICDNERLKDIKTDLLKVIEPKKLFAD